MILFALCACLWARLAHTSEVGACMCVVYFTRTLASLVVCCEYCLFCMHTRFARVCVANVWSECRFYSRLSGQGDSVAKLQGRSSRDCCRAFCSKRGGRERGE